MCTQYGFKKKGGIRKRVACKSFPFVMVWCAVGARIFHFFFFTRINRDWRLLGLPLMFCALSFLFAGCLDTWVSMAWMKNKKSIVRRSKINAWNGSETVKVGMAASAG